MKIHEYNEMMSYLTRPAQPIDRLNKAIGGGAFQGTDLGTREGFQNTANINRKEDSIKFFVDTFGENTLDNITQENFGVDFRELATQSDPSGKYGNLKKRLLKFKDFIKENNRMPTESEARKFGRAQRDKTIAETGTEEITEQDIRNKLIKNNKPAETFKGKIIFADENIQNRFEEELTKRYSNPRTSAVAKAAGVKSNKEIYEEFLKPAGYSESSARTIIDDYKKALDLNFKELTSAEKEQKKVEREILDRIITGGRRISGTKKNPAHHMFPLGDEIGAKPKEFTVIPEKINSRIAQGNKNLKPLVLERADILSKAYSAGAGINVKELDDQLAEVNKKAEKVISDHYKKYPEHEGLLNWKKLDIQLDDLGGLQGVRQVGTIGGDYTKWTLPNVDKTILDKNVANLSKQELAGFRNAIKQVDLIRENVTTANKISTPEKTKIRDMFKNFEIRSKESGPELDANRSLFKGLGQAVKYVPTPAGTLALNLGLRTDPTQTLDRVGLGIEAATLPSIFKFGNRITAGNPMIQKFFNLGMTPANAMRLARFAQPIGVASLAGEGLYRGAKYMIDRNKMLQSLTDEQRDELLRKEKQEAVGQMKRGDAEAFDYIGAADGGRIGFADGPDDPSKRKFMKIMGGLASLPILGKFIKPAVKVAPAALEAAKGMPEWFGALVDKVIKEGTDVTKIFATGERQSVYQKKLGDNTVVRVTQDADEGAIRVEYESPDNVYGDTVTMEYKKPLPDETNPNPGAEFNVAESGPVGRAYGPDDYEIEIDEVGGVDIKDLDSDVSALKEYATGKKPTIKEMLQNKKRKDKAAAISEGGGSEMDAVIRRQGEFIENDLVDLDPVN